MNQIIDPFFSCTYLNGYTNPFQTIYLAMRRDKSALPIQSLIEKLPSEEECGRRIMKHLIEGDRGHYGCVENTSITFAFDGFPHDVMVQARTHRIACSFDVCSQRYTGEQILDWAKEYVLTFYEHTPDVDKYLQGIEGQGVDFLTLDDPLVKSFQSIYYVRPEGDYTSRTGEKFTYTSASRLRDLKMQMRTCLLYYVKVHFEGEAPESARHILSQGIRQPFVATFNARSLMHFLDLRSKADAQLEIQCMCELLFEGFSSWMPALAEWYKEKRYGRARLSP